MASYRDHLEHVPRYFRNALGREIPGIDGDKVLICGMGGSGISGLITERLEPRKAVSWRDYQPPVSTVDAAIIISYSGNTEETLSCYTAAKQEDVPVVAITSGGQLQEQAAENDDAIVSVPDGLPPRAALPYLLTPVLRILNTNYTAALEQVVAALDKKQDTLRQHGKTLAEQCSGRIPLLYASHGLYPAAYRFKTQVNENAKQHAFAHVLPEAFHNEIVGYETGNAPVFPIFLLRNELPKADRMAQLIDTPHELLRMDAPLLDALLHYIVIGDWCSYFLAEENNVDPLPVDIIDQLKQG